MKSPSILFLNRVYPPAEGATGQLLAELAEELVRRGYSVTVITSRTDANVPRSEVVSDNSSSSGSRGNDTLAWHWLPFRIPRFALRIRQSLLTTAAAIFRTRPEIAAGVRVERVGGMSFTRTSHLRRALSYLSLYPAMVWRAARLPRHDILVTLTDPPMQVVCGAVLAALKRSKHVHWAQDVYPELAEEMGVLRKGGLLARLLRQLSTWALRKADGVVAVGRCMAERLATRGLSSPEITVIPNWGQTLVSCEWGVPGESFRREQGWGGRFVVMYSGNLGLAHSFDTILDSAALMQASKPEVLFVFVGHGPRLPRVKQQVAERGLGNVRFLPFQPKEKLTGALASADVHLACMRSELCGLVVPSKVYGVLAAARPCVFLGPEDSEAARLIREMDCGSVLPEPTGDGLARCLMEWAADSELMAWTRQRLQSLNGQIGVGAAARQFDELFRRVLDAGCVASLEPDEAALDAGLAGGGRFARLPNAARPHLGRECAKTDFCKLQDDEKAA